MRIPVNFALYWKAFFVERSLALVVNNLFGGFAAIIIQEINQLFLILYGSPSRSVYPLALLR
jgi:hypothetical protein